MPNKIKPKRSYTANSVPLTTDLDTHELAINWTDGKAFTKNASGQIVSITLGGSGGSTTDSRLDLFLPPAPASVSGTAGNGQVSLTWTAPTVLSQTPITDYIVQYSSNSGSTWTTFSDGTSTAASATVTGLQNGTGYTFRVAAVNGIGQGAFSTASSSVTPTATDPSFSSVVLLLHMDGTNGGTTFTDSSSGARSVTRNGATISTTQSKFGGASGTFNGSSDYLTVSLPDWSSSNFVIEGWFYITANPGSGSIATLWAHRADANSIGGPLLVLNSSGELRYYMASANGSSWQVADGATGLTVTLNQWNHIALVRSGTSVKAFLGGTAGTAATVSGAIYNSGNFSLMAGTAAGEQYVTGYADEVRVTQGTDRSFTGSTITVPNAAFPNS